MASRSYDRVDFYRRNRDYSSLLEDKEEEVDDKSKKYRKSAADEDSRARKERQDFVERREKLKELERIKLNQKYNGIYGMKTEHTKNENQISRYAENIAGNDKKRKMPNDNYGSFFGPSKPVIARRVIEEAQTRIEKAHLASKVSKEAPQPKKSSMTTTNTKVEYKKKPVIVNEATKKARQLKAARDYSFLFSEDAEIPGSESAQASETRNVTSSMPNSAQAKQMIAKNSIIKKPPLSSKPISQVKEVKIMASSSRQTTNKLDTQKKSVNSKQQLTKAVSGGQLARENGSKHHSVANAKTVGSASSDRKKLPLNSGSRVVKAEHRQSLVRAEQRSSVSHLTSGQKALPLKVPTPRPQAEQRKSVAVPKSMPPKPAPKLVPKPAPKLVPKPAPRLVPKPAPKPVPNPALKPVQKMAPKLQAKPSSRDLHHERPKKRSRDYVSDEDIDEGTNFRSLIRQMFRYDPNKYRDIDDDDDSDMEVGFSRIQAEERRSARIAREEDDRELALIEAEEREEKAKAKRRKLQNQR